MYRVKGGRSMNCGSRLEKAIDQYAGMLLRAAAAILGDWYEAEDAVQDTFLRMLEKEPVFRDPDHERAWLLTVTANGCKSRLRARKRHPTTQLLDTLPAPDEEVSVLVEAVAALPANQRAVVHLYYYEGYSTDEIAGILGQRPGTVRSHLSRARETLRTQLKENFNEQV